jgi:hypothetical protein
MEGQQRQCEGKQRSASPIETKWTTTYESNDQSNSCSQIVMKVREQKYLISVADPLQLTIVAKVDRETTEQLGQALQAHISILRSRGFFPARVHMDPQPALAALVGQFPGVEIDISGAGDHLDKIDAKIRRVKELIRSVHASLPWKLLDAQVKDLVTYAVNRINMRRTSASTTNVAPRVAFTGRKPNYKKEFAIGFGDYCECYDPKESATMRSGIAQSHVLHCTQ